MSHLIIVKSLLDQIEDCKSNPIILDYFNNTKEDFTKFIILYIELDKVIKNQNYSINSFDFNKKLSNISSLLEQQNETISKLPLTFNDNFLLLQNNIRNCSNSDITSIFNDFYIKISNRDANDIQHCLTNFKNQIDNINSKTINDFDQKILSMMSSLHNTLSSHSFNDKISNIESIVNKLHQNFTINSSKKGEYAENILHKLLIDTFKNIEIIDTHSKSNSGDFQLISDNKPTILIDSKHIKDNVPKRDILKFISDIQLNNCSGILANCFGGIANKEHLEIEIIDNNILIYIHEHQFNSSIFKLAVSIIYYLSDILKQSNSSDKMLLDVKLFNSLKTEYQYFLQTFNQQLNILKTSVNSLSQLHFNLIEQFFSRKAFTSDDSKPFNCTVCGSSFSSNKTLKQHLKNKHLST